MVAERVDKAPGESGCARDSFNFGSRDEPKTTARIETFMRSHTLPVEEAGWISRQGVEAILLRIFEDFN